MKYTDDFPPSRDSFDGRTALFVDLPALFGDALLRLPMVLRLLLENAVRNMRGEERRAAVMALFAWLEHGTSEAEIAFQPGRVLMHDTTSTPALVDIAAMRDALAEAGVDPSVLNPVLPVDVSVDHSLAVEAYARRDAVMLNLQHELRRNRERYRFLRWASKALNGVHINPPGTGIMHTINLEQLATVVTMEDRDGALWVVPDMMIGTDSHTPMINGIGVLGWGVGGLEAQTVMFGMPTMLRIPDVIGVRLTGALRPGSLATDLALTVTQRLRAIGVSGEFVEFFGPGRRIFARGRALRGRQHGARIRRHDGVLSGRSTHSRLPRIDRSQRAAGPAGGVLHPARGALVRSARAAALHANDRSRSLRRGHAHRGAQAAAGPARLCRRAQNPGGTGVHARRAPRRHAPSSGRCCRDHQLHEYVRSWPAYRRRAAGAQGTRARPHCAGLGQDFAGTGLTGRRRVLGARQVDR